MYVIELLSFYHAILKNPHWSLFWWLTSWLLHRQVPALSKVDVVHPHANGSLLSAHSSFGLSKITPPIWKLLSKTMLSVHWLHRFCLFLAQQKQIFSACSDLMTENISTGLLSNHLTTHKCPICLVAVARAPVSCCFGICSLGNLSNDLGASFSSQCQ